MLAALTRSALPALAVLISAALAGVAAADKPKPPPKPKPKITLLTETQEEALRKDAIKARVDSRRGRDAEIKGTFVVDGHPDDFAFRLGVKRAPLRGDDASVRWRLSAYEREVLDFAIKSCRGATVDLRVRVGRGDDREFENLTRPGECRPG